MLKVQLYAQTQSMWKWLLMLALTLCQMLSAVIITNAQKQAKAPRSRIYVANASLTTSPSISVIDSSTNAVSSTIAMDARPGGMAINPTGTRLFVSLDNGTVAVVDTATNTISASITLPTDGSSPASPGPIAINPDGSRVYVTYSDLPKHWLGVINTTTNAVIARLEVGPQANAIAVNPAGTLVFVSQSGGPTCNCALTVVDATNNTVLNRAELADIRGSFGLVASKDNKLYASNGGFAVFVIDQSTLTIINRFTVGFRSTHMIFDQDETHLFVISEDANSLSIIEISTGAIEVVHVGVRPNRVAIGSSGKFAYVVNFTGNSVSVIDLRTRTVIKNIGVGEFPVDIVSSP